jgi:hypothetical protein
VAADGRCLEAAAAFAAVSAEKAAVRAEKAAADVSDGCNVEPAAPGSTAFAGRLAPPEMDEDKNGAVVVVDIAVRFSAPPCSCWWPMQGDAAQSSLGLG